METSLFLTETLLRFSSTEGLKSEESQPRHRRPLFSYSYYPTSTRVRARENEAALEALSLHSPLKAGVRTIEKVAKKRDAVPRPPSMEEG